MTDELDDASLKSLFSGTGALHTGHFLLSSGLHSDQYFQCALVLSDTGAAERLGRALAGRVPPAWGKVTVVAPALGGLIIGHEVARALGARSIFAERKDGRMELRRGFRVEPGEPVVVVEDVVTTGKSTGEVLELLAGLGARPLGALAIVLRSAEVPDLGVPLLSLARLPAAAWTATECALCRAGLPLVKPGSREKPGAARS
ncbi:MAG: orotate phosphoribosyltransferase [Elusimicrobia bacterium]|nr:orotate phosphoribosyltransferase [Elusimicrobiota bacterium]